MGYENEFDTLAPLLEHFSLEPIDSVALSVSLQCKHEYRLGEMDAELQHGRDVTLNQAVVQEARQPRQDIVRRGGEGAKEGK